MVGVVLNIENGKREPASIKDLIDLTAADMGRVNELILSKAGSDVEMIPEIANHLISSGGKRLRPMLTLAAAQMFGYAGEGHVKLATSVEFMHTATLLHDDVVDESGMRRGKKTARMIWGNQASVLVGDFLLGQAFRMMVDVGSLRSARHPVDRRLDHRRGRGDAARRGQEPRNHRGRVFRGHQGQDRGAVFGRRRGRPGRSPSARATTARHCAPTA